MDNYEADRMILSLRRINQPENMEPVFVRAMDLLAELYRSGTEESKAIAYDLKAALLPHYQYILNTAGIARMPSGFIPLTEEWIYSRLNKTAREDLQSLEPIREKVIRKMREAGGDQEQCNKVSLKFELAWLAVVLNAKNGPIVSVSETAGAQARMEALTKQPDDFIADRLYDWLIKHFTDWMKEDFRSEHNGNPYSYKWFPELVKEWIHRTDLSEYSPDDLDCISAGLQNALTSGYSFDSDAAARLLLPIAEAREAAAVKHASSRKK